ncbi:MAG TPA: SDR family NAD(P)-dependent oxidoreductase [Puia sp.]|nr:SDR family NAD(P)-dependent oxidoreductase [Puia sp.]
MSKVLITGSADGLGKMAAQLLVAQGHDVVLHARNPQRAKEAHAATPDAKAAIHGDLSSIAETKAVAAKANELGPFDAIIHNAAIGSSERRRIATADGLPAVFAINSLAPYILTCLIEKPKRLVYLSSGLHRNGDASLEDLAWERRHWNGFAAYSDSKLHVTILAFAVARKWKEVFSNSVDPGWVATKMGGPGAPDSLKDGSITQAWLAVSDEVAAKTTGHHFYHKRLREFHPAAADPAIQDKLLAEFARFSGIPFPIPIVRSS